MGVSKTSNHIQIKIKWPNSSQEPPATTKAPNQDIKDMGVLCTFKVKIESQYLEYRCSKDLLPYPNEELDAKPQSGTYSPHQSPKSELQGHGCSLHLQGQDRGSKNSEHGCTKDQWPWPNKNEGANPNQKPPASSKYPCQDLEDMDVLFTFKINLSCQNYDHGYIK